MKCIVQDSKKKSQKKMIGPSVQDIRSKFDVALEISRERVIVSSLSSKHLDK
jgi:hypothetical protein